WRRCARSRSCSSPPSVCGAKHGLRLRSRPGNEPACPAPARTISATLSVMTVIEVTDDLTQLDSALEAVPNNPAVFLLWPKDGPPYLSKTTLLRRRLLRLLSARERPSKLLNLRHTVARIEYRLTGSAFENAVIFLDQARQHFPETYLDLMKLRMPPYVRIVLNNEFPRSHVTTHLTRSGGLHFGPFRSRAS